MEDCLFCQIAAGKIPSKKVYEDAHVLAFYDIEPKAPVHVLVIPKYHVAGAREITAENSAAVARVFEAIPAIAEKLGVTDYRIVTNNGADAGQTVQHLHFHLLAGRVLGEMG